MRSPKLKKALDQMGKHKTAYLMYLKAGDYKKADEVLKDSINLNKKIARLFDIEEGD